MTTNEQKYTREQFESSKKYANMRDLVKAVLKKDETYSVSEAEALINVYKERRI